MGIWSVTKTKHTNEFGCSTGLEKNSIGGHLEGPTLFEEDMVTIPSFYMLTLLAYLVPIVNPCYGYGYRNVPMSYKEYLLLLK